MKYIEGDIIADPELSQLLPPLSAGQYKLLEQSILEDGCRDPLVVWPLPIYEEDGETYRWQNHKLEGFNCRKTGALDYWLKVWPITAEGIEDVIDEYEWPMLLLDGHARFEICQKHGIDYDVIHMEFNNISQARDWIIRNQAGRRNCDGGDANG